MRQRNPLFVPAEAGQGGGKVRVRSPEGLGIARSFGELAGFFEPLDPARIAHHGLTDSERIQQVRPYPVEPKRFRDFEPLPG